MFQIISGGLTIVEESDARLVLREQPLLDWIIAIGLALTAIVMLTVQFWVTGILALVIAGFFVLQARTRIISFDTDPNLMRIVFRSFLAEKTVNETSLHSISRAYLFRGEDGGAQIVLTITDGEEIGLSSYTRNVLPWQENVVLAINGILHSAHKDDPNREVMV